MSGTAGIYNGVTLDGVTIEGPLTLGSSEQVNVTGGLTLEDAAGGLPGSVAFMSNYAELNVLDSETLDNATLDFGTGAYNSLADNADSGTTLTLGAGFTVEQEGGPNYLGGNPYFGYADPADTLINDGAISISGGELIVEYGTFVNNGTIEVQPGAAFLLHSGAANEGAIDLDSGTLELYGTLLGGTIEDAGGDMSPQGGTLDGVTVQGTLTLGYDEQVNVTGGLTLEDAAGGLPGSIEFTSNYAALTVLDSETLDHATLDFGTGVYNSLDDNADSGTTMTLGAGFTVEQEGGQNYLGGNPEYGYADPADTLINEGAISVSGGDLTVEYGTFINSGTIEVQTGAVLTLRSGVTNEGTIDLDGGTLDVNGTVLGGTIEDAGGDVSPQGGTLDGVTVQGPLTLGYVEQVNVTGGLTLEDAAGGLPGSIEFTSNYAALNVLDSETLDNATLDFGTGSDNSLGEYADSGTTLTLGAGFTVEQEGGQNALGGSFYYGDDDPADTLINEGAISISGGYLAVEYGTFVNNGSIQVQTGAVLYLRSGVTNEGTITVGSGATVEVDGDLTMAGSGAIDLDGGTLDVNGTVLGGTIEDAGGDVSPQGGTLDGVTVQGPLTLGYVERVNVTGGLTLEDAAGGLPGSVEFTSNYAALNVLDSETLDNATLDFGTGYYDSLDDNADSGTTLTLGAGFTVEQEGGQNALGGRLNYGDADPADTLINDGAISVSGGYLAVEYGAFVNNGSIQVQTGAVLDLQSGVTNEGAITVESGAAVYVDGDLTMAGSGAIDLDGGTLDVNGTLDNSGATLAIGPGSSLVVSGTLLGGTIEDPSGGASFQGSGVLDGVTVQGTLTLGYFQQVNVTGGLTLEDAAGGLPGGIEFTSNYAALNVLDSETLDNATLDFGTSYYNSLDDNRDSGTTLTLGAGFTVEQEGGQNALGGSFYYGYVASADTLINDGAISVSGGYLAVEYGTFVNNGTIDVQRGAVLTLRSDFTNTGTITVESGATLVLDGTVTTAGLGEIDVNGGTVELAGTLDNAGATLAPDAAVVLEGSGVIIGGTIQDVVSPVTFQGGTLDGVTYEGTLDLTASGASVAVTGGLTVTGADGAGPGVINLGYYSSLAIDDSETLDNATVTLGSNFSQLVAYVTYAAYQANGDQPVNQTLTLGPNLVLDQGGSEDYLGSYYYSNYSGYGTTTIVNQGTINAQASGPFIINPTDFINEGTLAVANGGNVSVQSATFTNDGTITIESGAALTATGGVLQNNADGTIEVQAGGLLDLVDDLTNLGAITIDAGGTLALGGSFTTAGLGAITINGGTVEVLGTLDNTGATLSVGPGDNITALVLENGGTILGGTIQDPGSPVTWQGGTLDGVTYDGTLDLTAYDSSVVVIDGLTATGADGTGPGTINIGEYSNLTVEDSETLDNATVTLSSYYSQIQSYVTYAEYQANGDQYVSQTLTLGPNLVLDVTGYQDYLGNGAGYGTTTIVNEGTIDAEGGSQFYINPTSFTNDGTITIESGATLTATGGVLQNDADGTIEVQSGGLLDLPDGLSNSGAITIDAGGTLALGGSFTTAGLGAIDFEGGTLEVFGTLDNSGTTLAVGPGDAITALVLENGGTVIGGTITDAGAGGVFTGGTLDGVTYTGTLDLTPYGSSVVVVNGLTATGADGAGPGTINIGAESSLTIEDSETLDNATVTLGDYESQLFAYVTYAAYLANGYQYVSQTLTFGPNLVIDQTGDQDYLGYYYYYYSGYGSTAIVNEGTINAEGSELSIEPTSFTNAGTLDITNGDSVYILSPTFSNDGVITIGSGSALTVSDTALVNNAGGTIEVQSGGLLDLPDGVASLGAITIDAGGTLALGGSVTTAELGAINFEGGTLALSGTLDNTGATLAVGPGDRIAGLVLEGNGVIIGGVIQDPGSPVTFQGGTLDGVTYEGTLDLTAPGSSVVVIDGLTATGEDGTGPGTINLGYDTSLTIEDSETLDNATVTLGSGYSQLSVYVSYADYQANDYQYANETLTLGSDLVIEQTGYQDYLGTYNYGYGYGTTTIVNQGTIDAEGSAQLVINPSSFTNAGTLDVTNGDSVSVQSPTFTNDGTITIESGSTLTATGGALQNNAGGTIEVQAGGLLNLQDGLANQGAITIDAGGTLALGGNVTTAELGAINFEGGTLALSGTLDNTGATLAVGKGDRIAGLVLKGNGVIIGGVIQDPGSPVTFQGGTLDGVTYEGTLDLTAPGSSVVVIDGLTATGEDGAGPGAIDIGYGSNVILDDSETLDNATVTFSSNYGGLIADVTYAAYQANGYQYVNETLTLGPNLVIDPMGYDDNLSGGGYGTITIVNEGTINAEEGSQFYISSSIFSNTGALNVSGGDSLYIQSTFTNLSGGTLAGGVYSVGANSYIYDYYDPEITTLAADLSLSGINSNFYVDGVQIDSTLTDIAAAGALRLLGGRNFTTGNDLTDQGTIQLGGGALTANALTIDPGATLAGFGTVEAAITAAGLIEAQGGTLDLALGVSGTPALQIDAGATLELGAPRPRRRRSVQRRRRHAEAR